MSQFLKDLNGDKKDKIAKYQIIFAIIWLIIGVILNEVYRNVNSFLMLMIRIIPLFLILILGYVLRRRKRIKSKDSDRIN